MDLHLPALAAALVAAALLTLWRPWWGLLALFAALPFLTHHPSTAPAVWLMALVSAFEAAWVLRERPAIAGVARALAAEPVLALAVAFAGAAVASLAAMPLEGLWREYAAAFRLAEPRQWPDLVALAVRHLEFRREFPVTSALLTVQAAVLMLIVYRETRTTPGRARQLALALVAGVTVWVGAGMAELAGAVHLTPLRGEVGVFVRPDTLQATAGNPGWFTEFVVYTLPYGLVLLGGRPLRSGRGLLLAAFTALLALALLFGYQRGGWIAGLVVLTYVAAAASALSSRASADVAGARRLLVTGAVVIALLAVVAVRWRPPVQDPSIDFGERLRSIGSGDRWPYWQAAGLIWTRHPILGGGHESFAFRYRAYFQSPGGIFATSAVRVPDAASAHSLYMQTLAGTGALGLALLGGIFVAAAITWQRARAAQGLDSDRQALVLAAGGSLAGVAVYGLVQEVFYVHALRLLFFTGAGLLAGAAPGVVAWPRAAGRALAAAVVAGALAHVGYERAWGSPERLIGPGTTGFFAPESNAGHEAIQWTTEEAAAAVPPQAGTVEIAMRSAAPFPQEVRVWTCDARTAVTLADPDWHTVSVPLRGCAPGAHVRLQVLPAWRPAGDGRLLGVMTRGVAFR